MTAPELISLKDARAAGLTYYFTGVPCNKGHISKRMVSSRACRVCADEHVKRSHIKYPERHRRYTANWRKRNLNIRILNNARARTLINDAKKFSKGRKLEFSLTLNDIIVPENCPCCGVFLRGGIRVRQGCSPSLDRVDNAKGYIRGNVAIICWGCNRRKYDSSVEQLRQLV